MFKDLFVTIAAGVIGALPVAPAPAVAVTTDNVEASVVQYIENHENRTVTLDCDFNTKELSITEGTTNDYHCLTTDKENKETFNTVITISAVNKKVSISAVLDRANNSQTPTPESTTTPTPTPTATPSPTETK